MLFPPERCCIRLIFSSEYVCGWVCVSMQDGGKALQAALSCNTSLTECDVRLTEMEGESASAINQVVWSNRRLER